MGHRGQHGDRAAGTRGAQRRKSRGKDSPRSQASVEDEPCRAKLVSWFRAAAGLMLGNVWVLERINHGVTDVVVLLHIDATPDTLDYRITRGSRKEMSMWPLSS